MYVQQFMWALPLQFWRYCYFSKLAKFPFRTMDYIQSMVVKNLNQIELAQKFMQVEVDVVCIYINFCGHGLYGFGDIATFQNWPNFPFGPLVHGGQKLESNRIGSKD